jgi:N-acetylglucosaminylphosphatidylinositol deacetylase
MYGCLSFTAVVLALLCTLLHGSIESNNVFTQHQFAKLDSDMPNARVLFLTAHPDDECMFFAPTIMALTSKQEFGDVPAASGHSDDYSNPEAYPEVFSLCLSVGDADGLGDLRKEELGRSLDVLGIRNENRAVVDHLYVFYSIIFLGLRLSTTGT